MKGLSRIGVVAATGLACAEGLFTEINGTDGSARSLASVIDRDTQPNE
jgi:hypothetical protein